MYDKMKKDLEARTREAQDDPRTAHEFIAMALTEPDEHKAWEAVAALHFRGTREVFDAACQLCASACSQQRTLGANILGQLGIPTRSFPDESVAVLLKLLEFESGEGVLDAICIALGHIHDPKAIPWLSCLKTHSSGAVRYAVVFGLLGFEDQLAVNTLIELSQDEDEDVRDWATFGLGSQIEADTPQIREALFARLFDSDEATRGEALVGLARRKDPRVIEPLIEELERYPDAEHGDYGLEAAEQLADARLLPVLTRLKEAADSGNRKFDDAIRRCSERRFSDSDKSLSS
jgi:HEAT repeat protein